MILTQRNKIDNEHPVLQRHKFEVNSLHPRPQQKVIRHARYIRLPQPLLRARTLKICHRRKEDTHVDGREDELVAGYTGGDCTVLGGEVYAAGEEVVPFGCCGAEDR